MQGDLALALGFSLAQVKRLSEREFNFWYAYRARKMFPARRMEVMQAQSALVAARIAGNKSATIADFLIHDEDKPKPMTAKQGAAIIGALGGAGMYKLGQKKNRK